MLALPDARLDPSSAASTGGKPAPLVLTPLEMLRKADAEPTPQRRSASTNQNDRADGDGGGRTVPIPAGQDGSAQSGSTRAPRSDYAKTATTKSVAVVATSAEAKRRKAESTCRKQQEEREKRAPATALDKRLG